LTEPHDDTTALQTCLAAEHAAVYAYAVIGGRLTGFTPPASVVDEADGAYEWHRAQRDSLDALIRQAGASPTAAEPAYTLPVTPDRVAQCQRLARYLENRCCDAYAYGVSLATDAVRATLAHALGECAVRAALWGARLDPFPGRRDL
jgi:hypothetical protein